MNTVRPFVASAVIALLVIAGLVVSRSMAQAPAPPAPTPVRLAVINVQNVFARLDEKAKGDDEIEAMGKQINADKNKKETDLKKMDADLRASPFRQGSPEYKKQQDDLMEATMTYQVFLQVSEQKLLMLQRLKTEAIYRAINDAVKKYAEANGIAIVFVTDDADFSQAQNVQQLKAGIGMRKIMYAHPDYDITSKIVESMNAAFKQSAH